MHTKTPLFAFVTTMSAMMVLTLGLVACSGEGGDNSSNSAGASANTSGQGSANAPVRARAMAVTTPATPVQWSATQTLPLVPAAAAHLPDGKILLWSSDSKFNFTKSGLTYAVTLDPATGTLSERTITETGHNMFCPGTTNLPDGRLLVNGGVSDRTTSLFDATTGTWTQGAPMNIPRGYNANTVLQDGSVLTLGGAWSGGVGGKHAERWTEATGWQRLPGVPVDPFLYPDPENSTRYDNHMALIPTGNGKVFHVGPSKNMHWIDTRGTGAVIDAGPRGDDEDSQSGTVVMYDTGKVLKAGGSRSYQNVEANANSYLIDLTAGVSLRKITPMAYHRAFQNGVVLPNGQVLVIGGQTFPIAFRDDRSVLTPELFDPDTETFQVLPPMSVPRNYHSVALLLPDGRVLSAGGGLCGAGCTGNHADYQILTPSYLLNADGTPAARPAIVTAPSTVQYGQSATVTTDSAVSAFAMIRLSSTTHTVNNDQRRLSLSFRETGTNTYAVDVPTNPGWALPGDWMLFALNAQGVPSVSKIWRVTLSGAAAITPIDDQTSASGAAVTLQPTVTVPSGATASYSATGLPAGLSVESASGRIFGTPSTVGRYPVSLRVKAGNVTVSTDFVWTVLAAVNTVPNVALRQPATQSSTWDTAVASRAVDGNRNGNYYTGASVAHTQSQASPWWEVDLGVRHTLSDVVITNRSDCCAARLRNFYVMASDTPMQGRTLAQLLADTSVWRSATPGTAPASLTLNAAGAQGRYVRVQLAGTGFLQLAEVEVHGQPVSTTAPTGPVSLQPMVTEPVASGASMSYTALPSAAGSYSYQWNFGDGSALSPWQASATTTHVYAKPGVYQVTVTQRSSDGSIASRMFWQAVTGASGAAGRASSSVALDSRSGQPVRIWVANSDNDSVSVFDAAMNTRLAEIPVGRNPRTLAVGPDGRVWVANGGSSSLSIVSPTTLSVVQTVALPRASRPWGVVVGRDGSAFVAQEATGTVTRLSAAGVPVASVSLGQNLRHLALDSTGAQLFVSRYITPPLPGEGTATVQTSVNGQPRGGELLLVNTASMTLHKTLVLQHSERPDSTVQGRGIPNYLGAMAIAPDGKSAWVPSKQDNIKRGALRDGQALDFQNTVRAVTSRIDLTTLSEDLAGRVDHDNSGVASAAVYHPSGAYLFVALEATRHVAVLDPVSKRELFRVDAGRAPQGLVVSPDGLTLYVHNVMDRTVGVLDLTRLIRYGESTLPLSVALPTVATDKLSAQVKLGKQLFYDARDPRLARDGYLSCAACHNDGTHDGRVWDLTHLGEGLRNTLNLRGRAGGQGPLHWSANFDEVQDFEGQIRNLGQGTGLMTDAQYATGTRRQPLGDKKAGVSPDLDALVAYVASLSTFDPSPNRTATGELTSAAVLGKAVFATRCVSCHGGQDFTNSPLGGKPSDVGTIKASSGKRLNGPLTGLDVPTLRDVCNTAPYLHDGSAATLSDAITAHNNLATLSATDRGHVVAFIEQIGAEEPAVTAVPGPFRQLLPMHSGLCVGVVGDSLLEGASIEQNRCVAGAQRQLFQEVPVNGGFMLRNALSGLCLDVWVTKSWNGARIIQRNCTESSNQIFNWKGDTLVIRDSQMCLDVTGGYTGIRTTLDQLYCAGLPQQRFLVR